MKKALLPFVLLVVFFSLSIYFLKHRFCNNTPDEPGVAAALTANRATEIPSRTSPAGETRQANRIPAKSSEGKIERLESDNTAIDHYATAVILKTSETKPDKTGYYERKRLVRADFKYPLILLEERLKKDSQTGADQLLQQSAMVADHVMVKVQPDISETEVNQAVSTYGGHVRKKMYAPGFYLVEIQNVDLDSVAQAVRNFSKVPGLIVYAEPDYIEHALSTTPNDPRFGELWGMHNTGQSSGTPDADIDAPEAWDITTGRSNILVAVIDSGIDYTHPDLAANMWINSGEAGSLSTNGIDDDGNGFIDDARGWDFYNDDNDSMDDNSHGTHCAGTIGAVGNNGTGVVGVCWNVSLVGLKFLGANGTGPNSAGIDATYYAARLGARMISASYGGGSPSQAGYDSIANAGASNMLFIAAAGNSADDNDVTPHYPSSYTNDNVIAVANSTSTETLSGSSCYGLTSVDLAAPGSSILSTIPGGGYGTKSGTSMATPHVAGAAALLWSYNSGMSATEVKAALMATVDTNAAFAGKMVSGGRLNINRAIRSMTGLYFDQADYFPSTWATLSLLNNQLAGSVTQSVQITTESGDSETLILHETPEQNYRFTNRIWIVESGAAMPGNGQIESVRGPAIRAVFTNSTLQITNTAIASVVPRPVVPVTNLIVRWGMGNTNIVTNTVSCLRSPTYTTNWANPAVGINYYPDSANASPYFSSAFGPSVNLSSIYNSSPGDYIWNYRISTNGAVFSGMMMWRDFLIFTNLTDITFQGARSGSATTNLNIRLIVEKSGNYYISDIVVTNITPTVSTTYLISTTGLNWNVFTPFVNGTGTIGGATSVTMDNLTGIGYYFTARNCYTNTGTTSYGVRMYGFEARNEFIEPATNPVLDYVSTLTTDEDSDGRNEPGETINAYITLANEGTAASNVAATVVPQGIAASNFEVSNSPGSFGTITAGGRGSNSVPFVITAINPASPLGTYTFSVTGMTSDDPNTVFTVGRSFQINLEQGFSVYGQDAQNTFYMAADFDRIVTNTAMVITNSSGLPLVCTLTESAPWLSLLGGTTLTIAPHSSSNVVLVADSVGLQGAYSAPLTVAYNQTATNFTSFTVSLIAGPMITPLTGSAVITEVGGVNRLPGQFERGEILNITVHSTNNGAVAVSGITNTLFANPAFFTIAPPSTVYPVMNAGDGTSTTYQVTISATTPRGTCTFYVTNTTGAYSWSDSFSLPVTAQTNRLTVVNGSGDGFYMEGETIPVVANTASPGQLFDRWAGDALYVSVVTAATTTVTMPTQDVQISATYIDNYDHTPGLASLGKLFADPTADAEAIVYSNGYAYVACGYAGLIVFDVSNPTSPVRVGGYDTDGFAKALAIQSNKVFIADDRFGLQIVDVTNPASPVLAGKYATSGSCYDIAVSGQYAYLAAYSSGMLVFNISNPASPQLVKSYNAGTTRAYGIAVNGNYAYVADYTNGLKIIDVSTPANPVLSGSCAVPGQARDVAVQSGYAYVAAYTNGLQIINVSNPSAPSYAGGYETKYSYGVAVEGSFAYLANSGYGVEIVDVSNPSVPISSGVFNGHTGSASGVFAADGKVYVANASSGIQIVDVTEPTLPALLGSYDTHRYAYDVAVKGSYAYLAAYQDGLITVDISSPDSPVIVSTNKWSTYSYAHRLDISGDTLYVAAEYDGLVVYNLSNPASPAFVTKYDFVSSGYIYDVKVSGNYAFCVNGYFGSTNTLGVVNVSDPANPFYVGGYKTSGAAYEIDVQGQYAYLASYTNGLQIFDISTPTSPVLKGAYRATSPYAGQVSVSENYAYVLDNNDVLQIVDIQNPDSPVLRRTLDLGNITASDSDVFATGSRVYIAYGNSSYPTNNGLWVVDVSDMDRLVVTNYPTSGYGRGIAVAGGYVYLADDPKALHIFTFGEKEMTGISIDGSSRLIAHSTNTYTCRVQYTDGSSSNVTDSASWSLIGSGATLNGNVLSVGDIASDSTVTVRAVYGSVTNTLPVILKFIPPGLTYLGSLFDDPTADAGDPLYTNGYVYLACQYAGVLVFDVHTATNPIRVGGYDTDGRAWRCAMRSNLLFVADSEFGVTILDVSVPTNPVLAGQWQEPSETMGLFDVAVSGNYAYLAATDRGMLVIDISNISSPQLVAEYKGCRAQGLTVDGNYAYIVNSSNLLHIVDIGTPTNPVMTGSYPVPGGHELMIHSNYAYIAGGATNGLQIIDVHDPANPVFTGSFVTNYSWNMSMSWPYVYLPGYPGLKIIDVNTPSSPVLRGIVPSGNGNIGSSHVVDDIAYIGNASGGLLIADVSDSAAPVLLGSYDTHRYAYDVAVKGSYAYVAANMDGLITVDMSNPNAPAIVATNKSYNAYRLDIVDNRLFAAGSRLVVFDLSNPAAPSLVQGTYFSSSTIRDVKVSGNYAYCADSSASSTYRLRIVDVSNPGSPRHVGGYNTGGQAWGIDVQGTNAYLACGTNGMLIFNVSNPSNPVLRAAYLPATNSNVGRVVVSGNYAYALDNRDVLQIINISNPGTPSGTSTLDLGSVGSGDADIFLAHPYVYIAFNSWGSGQNGLWVVDISDPANPVAVTNYPTSGFGRGVAAEGGYVYLADDPKFLHTFTWGAVPTPVKTPTNITILGSEEIRVGETNTYSCELRYSDKSFSYPEVDMSIAGSSHSAVLSSGYILTADSVVSNTAVTLQAEYSGLTDTLTVLVFFDEDGDGVADRWESQYLGSTTNINLNAVCSNGINTFLEAYVAGLDPTDPNAAFLTSILPGRILRWNAVSGRVYSVYWTTNLMNGFPPQPLATNIPWTQASFTNSTTVPRGYYKIDVRLE